MRGMEGVWREEVEVELQHNYAAYVKYQLHIW
jgi:hypothetical protein